MAFNTPYEFLSPNDIFYLSHTNNQSDRLFYIDCLALLDDLLTSFSSSPDHWIFPPEKNKEDVMESLSNLSWRDLQDNLKKNLSTAWDLYEELNSSNRSVTSFTARSLADKFLNDLLEQYLLIRYSRVP
jgi:hypothetical protein